MADPPEVTVVAAGWWLDAVARRIVPFWSAALTDPAFAELHERAMTSCRRYVRRCLREAVKRREIAAPRTARQHDEAVEMLLSILTGAQVLGVLTPKDHTPAMMWKLVDGFFEQLTERKARDDA